MVGVFAATDVFLFYVFFEAMLIPVYFLIGSFGGAQRQYAAVKFLLYSLAGGLLMLVAVIALYFAGPKAATDGFLLTNLVGHLHFGPTTERLMFLGFFFAFAIKAPMCAGAHLAARRRGRGAAGDRGAAGRRPRQGRHLRDDPVLPAAVPGGVASGRRRWSSCWRSSRSCTARCSRSARPTSCG